MVSPAPAFTMGLVGDPLFKILSEQKSIHWWRAQATEFRIHISKVFWWTNFHRHLDTDIYPIGRF